MPYRRGSRCSTDCAAARVDRSHTEPVEPTFIDDVLAGRAQVEDIHDYIDRWHEAPADSSAAAMKLHEFLGMSWDEYRQWGEEPETLLSMVAARRAEGGATTGSRTSARTWTSLHKCLRVPLLCATSISRRCVIKQNA